MNRTYWEKIAPDYDDEIFDVLHNDKKTIIRSAIEKLASPNKTVTDIGCAVGKWLPILSPAFKKVYAVDISAKNLRIAKKNCPQCKNIKYLHADMSDSKTKVLRCDLAICINAILSSSLKKRTQFFQSLSVCIKKSGYTILVVPSLESYLFTSIVANQWKIDRNLLSKKYSGREALLKWNNIRQGNADIDNVPTKHYLKEELTLLLSHEGFLVEDFRKIEYDWNTEFIKTPSWLKKPRPWDWMVVARKK
jgi:2-polyprenyl-3-methyl-5-hydroxy-6-metoxy-1,4-benzoquinol methylase